MIPTLLVLGVMAGMVPRGWVFIGLAAIGWPTMVWAFGDGSGGSFFLAAAALGAANAAAGWAAGLPLRLLAFRIVDRLVR